MDVSARLARHNAGQGAKYTRARRPCELVYVEKHNSEASARRREAEIKGWKREKKQGLIGSVAASVEVKSINRAS